MTKDFPKKLYITMLEYDDDEPDYSVSENVKQVASEEEENVLVAVYELVKIGTVKKISKIVFE